jgi:elongation factor 1-beta
VITEKFTDPPAADGFRHAMGPMPMGDVICVFRIMPESPEVFDQVKKSLEKLKPQRIEEEPIAFGLRALKFTKIIPDRAGTQDELENKLESIKGVNNVETLMVSRSM